MLKTSKLKLCELLYAFVGMQSQRTKHSNQQKKSNNSQEEKKKISGQYIVN